MFVIDPLKLKIRQLLADGQANPLNQARLRYGTEDDLNILLNEIKQFKPDSKNYVFIDFTPFERIGHPDRFIKELSSITHTRPIILTFTNSVFSGKKDLPLINVQFNDDGQLAGIYGGSLEDKSLKETIKRDIPITEGNSALRLLREAVAERKLTDLLFGANCLDIPCRADKPETVKLISGRYYRKMTNGMLVSCYLNLKEIGRSPDTLLTLAYELIVSIMANFQRNVTPLDTFDYLVTPNNTALFLTSCVQAILEKPVLCIDRLGPIPALHIHSPRLYDVLHDRKVILIEEVIATGNEVDRTVFFLHSKKANISKIYSFYNLQVGKPMLADESLIVSLCRPKEELQYVYRSA